MGRKDDFLTHFYWCSLRDNFENVFKKIYVKEYGFTAWDKLLKQNIVYS